jgi:Mn-dependent DtxR family transcriptional regulator
LIAGCDMAEIANLYDETALEFLARNKGVATRGIASRFGMTIPETRSMLAKLLTADLVEMDSGQWHATQRGIIVASLTYEDRIGGAVYD